LLATIFLNYFLYKLQLNCLVNHMVHKLFLLCNLKELFLKCEDLHLSMCLKRNFDIQQNLSILNLSLLVSNFIVGHTFYYLYTRVASCYYSLNLLNERKDDVVEVMNTISTYLFTNTHQFESCFLLV